MRGEVHDNFGGTSNDHIPTTATVLVPTDSFAAVLYIKIMVS